MGLDMYLVAKKHFSGYSFEKEERQQEYKRLLSFLGITEGEVQTHTPSADIGLTVAYWRKANQIHKWFVDNVQDGVDECQNSYVEREKLLELLTLCKKILGNKHLASTLLPAQSGFFFGQTEYNDYYFEDLEYTVGQLKSILDNPKFEDWTFEYHSSW